MARALAHRLTKDRHTAHRLPRSLAALLLGAAPLFAGCRSYGGDYGNTEKTYEALLVAAEQLDEALARAQTDVALLQQAVETDAALQPALGRFVEMIERHEEVREEIAHEIAEVGEDPDDYREIHNTLGAVISEQRVLQSGYAGIIEVIATSGQGAAADTLTVAQAEFLREIASHYMVVPVYYYRAVNQSRRPMSMREALRRRSGIAAPTEAPADTSAALAQPEQSVQQ